VRKKLRQPANPPRPKRCAPRPKPAKPAGKEERQTRKKMTPLRARIAQRLVQAQHEAAMLTTFNEVDMSAVMALRAKYQDAS
jgi:2-oxoglutarate dehydrogenase E2 component (dihydrolipoamide succinyltransferase)